MRKTILNNWPLAAGEQVLGYTLPERRLHSVVTAAQDIGVGTALLEKFLIGIGALDANDPRPAACKIFDAKQYQASISEIPNLVGSIKMAQAMGATRNEFASLVQNSIISPVVPEGMISAPWRVSDGINLVQKLQADAIQIPVDNPGWETFSKAQLRLGISLHDLIEAIPTKGIQVGRMMEKTGYSALCMRKVDADKIRKKITKTNREQLTAAEFSRSIGLREKGLFQSLIEDGHTPARRVQHPTNKSQMYVMSAQDIDAFHRRFMTASTISAEFNLHRNAVYAQLRKCNVQSFAVGAKDYGAVFLRSEIEVAISSSYAQTAPL